MLRLMLLLVFPSTLAISIDNAEARYRESEVFRLENNELLYTESHYESVDNDLIRSAKVKYHHDNKLIAEKYVDFSGSRFAPEFRLINHKTGHEEIVKRQGNEAIVSFKQGHDQPSVTRNIIIPENAIIDAGFDQFVIEYWNQLLSGKRFKREFLIPSKHRFIAFDIYLQPVDATTSRTIFIEPSNFFLGLLIGKLRLVYRYEQPELQEFIGISNMRDENGKNYKVRIIFSDTQNALDAGALVKELSKLVLENAFNTTLSMR